MYINIVRTYRYRATASPRVRPIEKKGEIEAVQPNNVSRGPTRVEHCGLPSESQANQAATKAIHASVPTLGKTDSKSIFVILHKIFDKEVTGPYRFLVVP